MAVRHIATIPLVVSLVAVISNVVRRVWLANDVIATNDGLVVWILGTIWPASSTLLPQQSEVLLSIWDVGSIADGLTINVAESAIWVAILPKPITSTASIRSIPKLVVGITAYDEQEYASPAK